MLMNKPLSIVFLVVGVILLVLGVNAEDSFASSVSKLWDGTPTNRAVWLLVGGAILTILGLIGVLRKPRSE